MVLVAHHITHLACTAMTMPAMLHGALVMHGTRLQSVVAGVARVLLAPVAD
jgi:glycerol dehydrogenase-like iron-containing ADH family enzyme